MSLDHAAELKSLLSEIKPPGPSSVTVRPELTEDESRWFLAAVGGHLIEFAECRGSCPRLLRSGVAGGDEFLTPAGRERHLYSAPGSPGLRLNREYIPHIAAYAYAILKAGYSPERATFSRYRRFSRDLITKKAGQSYETDAEFAGDDGRLELHIEVKTWPEEVERIAAQIDDQAELGELPLDVVKEVDYVLDLAPRHLWVVGPGTVDPPRHIFSVEVDGLDARFERVSGLRTQRSGK